MKSDVQLLKEALHHLEEHAREYKHPGQPDLILEITKRLAQVSPQEVAPLTTAQVDALVRQHTKASSRDNGDGVYYVDVLDKNALVQSAFVLGAAAQGMPVIKAEATCGQFESPHQAKAPRAPGPLARIISESLKAAPAADLASQPLAGASSGVPAQLDALVRLAQTHPGSPGYLTARRKLLDQVDSELDAARATGRKET